jgi:diguanylate cyclase (GGDEF)-like protein
VAILFAVNLIQGLLSFSLLGYFFEQAVETAENEIIQANQRLINMANTDPVTSMINRRVMMNRIEDEKAKVDRGGKPFTIIMVDIDNFKQVNDEYGHDGGDFVLIRLSERISYALRKTDLVSRWGGDEFLLMLPETRLADGKAVAEKVRNQIITTPFVYRELDIPVTMTFGVSECNANNSIASSIRKADQALYRGKQLGKNQVVAESLVQI